jgi:hypothetical protein
MGGGSSQTVTFNDTSEFMYRDSSTKRGGFKGNIGYVTNKVDTDTDGTENILRGQELMTLADRNHLNTQISALEACTINTLCADKAELKTKSDLAWSRATTLYPSLKALIDTEMDDLKTEAFNELQMWNWQWARTAGSSLNCLVGDLTVHATAEISRRMAGVLAEKMIGAKDAETRAIADAFTMEFNARVEPTKVALAHIGTLFGILRGANVTETTDRDYAETRAENSKQFTFMGEFYHEVTDISAAEGTYAGDLDNAYNLSSGLAGIIGAAP